MCIEVDGNKKIKRRYKICTYCILWNVRVRVWTHNTSYIRILIRVFDSCCDLLWARSVNLDDYQYRGSFFLHKYYLFNVFLFPVNTVLRRETISVHVYDIDIPTLLHEFRGGQLITTLQPYRIHQLNL
jgi:hypothetical protein